MNKYFRLTTHLLYNIVIIFFTIKTNSAELKNVYSFKFFQKFENMSTSKAKNIGEYRPKYIHGGVN